MNNDFQKKDAIRYFLGELSETEQSALEERFFTDPEFSEWLDEVETDLIDDYARGELSGAERQKFEQNFMVSERRRERIKAAAALWETEKNELVPRPATVAVEKPQNSFWASVRGFFSLPQLAAASLAVLLLAALAGFFLFKRGPDEIVKIGNENIKIEPTAETSSPAISPEISPTAPPPEIPPNENSAAQVSPRLTPRPTAKPSEPKPETRKRVEQLPPVVAQIDLDMSTSRAEGGSHKIRLRKETDIVYFSLTRDGWKNFAKYRVEFTDADGKLVLSREMKSKKALNLTIPAKKLSAGNYLVTLKGAKTAGKFENLSYLDIEVETEQKP